MPAKIKQQVFDYIFANPSSDELAIASGVNISYIQVMRATRALIASNDITLDKDGLYIVKEKG